MTPLDFVAANLGKLVTAPGGVGGQCVDLTNLYLQDVWNLPLVRANAVDWQTWHLQGRIFTPNNPTNFPPVGAIVVFNPYPAAGIGQYGHICIALEGDSFHFVSVDQDWPYGAPVNLQLHDYGGVAGWFH